MEQNKKWVIRVFLLSFFFLFMIVLINITIDPFYRFHRPLKNISYIGSNSSYINPGIVKNIPHDTIMVGSSMVENFSPNWFKEHMQLSMVKTPYPGGTPKNMKLILSEDFATNSKLSTVFWGLDAHRLRSNFDEYINPLPEYMYEEGLICDTKYILNEYVLANSLTGLAATLAGNEGINMDTIYQWYQDSEFGKNIVMENYEPVKQIKKSVAIDTYMGNVTQNMEKNIIPIIASHPDIQFNIFFPPYSIAFWDSLKRNGELDALLFEEEYIISQLLEYPNVKLYYFQNIEKIVCNLDHYKDTTHYSKQINEYMQNSFKSGNHIITKDNYQKEIAKLRNIVINYKYP